MWIIHSYRVLDALYIKVVWLERENPGDESSVRVWANTRTPGVNVQAGSPDELAFIAESLLDVAYDRAHDER
jgi:hypothetical protein